MSETYTDRFVSDYTARRIEDGAVTSTDGWTAGAPPEVIAALRVGDAYGLETRGGPFGTICGWRVAGRWISRKSDQQIDRERQEWVAVDDRKRAERLERNRLEYQKRELELPSWVRDRLAVFHRRGGEKFEKDGWAYELVICELACLYAQTGCEDTDKIDHYARSHGTSGNQHECAKSLARAHAENRSLSGTVSGLTPITGDPFYECR